jgi:hypothetical protein
VSNPSRHVLNDIYLNCFNIKDKNNIRGREMAIGCTNRRDGKRIWE